MENFKPFLIKGFEDVDSLEDKIELIKKFAKGDISDYMLLKKKDGCRTEVSEGKILGRSLKPIVNKWLIERYSALAKACAELGIILEGEVFSRNMGFNEISRRFRTPNVTDPKHRNKLLKLSSDDLRMEYYGRDVEWLCSNHDDLKIWLFDIVDKNNESLYAIDRLDELYLLFSKNGKLHEFKDIVILPDWTQVNTYEELITLYEQYIADDWEGIVLMHKYSPYKCGRATVKEGTIFKLKEDTNEYDGQIIEVVEGEVVKEGVDKTVNELGRSVTSKLQENREPSGMASGLLVKYGDGEFTVNFKGCCHATLKDIWENKEEYVGQWIKYTGMKPTKRFPRHSHTNTFRDEK